MQDGVDPAVTAGVVAVVDRLAGAFGGRGRQRRGGVEAREPALATLPRSKAGVALSRKRSWMLPTNDSLLVASPRVATHGRFAISSHVVAQRH